jgi:hypothetical protein
MARNETTVAIVLELDLMRHACGIGHDLLNFLSHQYIGRIDYEKPIHRQAHRHATTINARWDHYYQPIDDSR